MQLSTVTVTDMSGAGVSFTPRTDDLSAAAPAVVLVVSIKVSLVWFWVAWSFLLWQMSKSALPVIRS